MTEKLLGKKQKMASQVLEQILDNILIPKIGQNRMYQTIDIYTVGTTQLYSFDPPKPIGLQNAQPFQFGYDLPGTNTQYHFHGSDKDHLTYGKIVDYNKNTLFEQKDSFKLAMDDLRFDQGGFKKFP